MYCTNDGLKIGCPAPVPPEPCPEKEIISRWERPAEKPLVSVIVDTYQHVDFVSDALNGILMQETNFSFEIIVHDDASTDGTREVIQRYAASYPNIIRIIFQDQNQFSKGHRPQEYTFPLARGKYIALCEGDDYWLDQNKLQMQAQVMEQDPNCAVSGHDAFIFEDGVVVGLSKLPPYQKRDFDSVRLKKGVFVLTLSMMFVNRIQDTPPEQLQCLNADKFMLSRLGAFGGYRYVSNIKQAAYRVHKGGVWSALDKTSQSAKRTNTLYWLSRYYSRLGDSRMETYFASQIVELLCAGLHRLEFRDMLRILRTVVKRFIKGRLRV